MEKPSLKEQCFAIVDQVIDQEGPGTKLQIEYEELAGKYGSRPNGAIWDEFLRDLQQHQALAHERNKRTTNNQSRVLFSGPAGMLAREATGIRLPLTVLQCAKGYYLGTADESGPVSRESVEYWSTEAAAQKALSGTESIDWMQRPEA